jgi:predicted HicB family RNase H-like nuclease
MNLSYKGYTTILKRDPDSRIWYGRVSNIQDMVTFEAKTQTAAEEKFRKSIDAYLSFCQILGQMPNPPVPLHSSTAKEARRQEMEVRRQESARRQRSKFENAAEF